MKSKRAVLLTLAILAVSFLLTVIIHSFANAGYNKKRNLTVVFYNVENLFDTENSQGVNDAEFTPESEKKWTPERYQKKLEDISRVLSSVNQKELPEIIGLCEIENRKVLNDLVKTETLAGGEYEIAHFESPDFRGIDVVLLYRPDEFKVTWSAPVKVSFAEEPDFTTRDILYVKGETINREEFHIFVNHWPSRIGGLEQTERKRIAVAQLLKSKIDSVQNVNPEANIIVMGDMNDEPSNKSLNEVLSAKRPETENASLINLMYPVHEAKQGSYNYRGNWNMLDHIILSGNLLDPVSRLYFSKPQIFQQDWMMYEDATYGKSPNRTYGGARYFGGYSDHLPIFME